MYGFFVVCVCVCVCVCVRARVCAGVSLFKDHDCWRLHMVTPGQCLLSCRYWLKSTSHNWFSCVEVQNSIVVFLLWLCNLKEVLFAQESDKLYYLYYLL